MILGEKHNLGKAVIDRLDGFIEKPRSIYWEKLFLDKNSLLKKKIANLAKQDAVQNPMEAFADLIFPDSSAGLVEKLVLNEIECINDEQSKMIGGTLATAAWFGLTDLHFQNMMCGFKDKFIFTPIDIECVFEDLELLSQTQMVISQNAVTAHIGCTNLLKYQINVAALCSGFLDALNFYSRNQLEIDAFLLIDPAIFFTPLRVILKPTHEYVSTLNGGNDPQSYYNEELVQLERGDVPYFCSYLNHDHLYYTGNDGNAVKSNLVRSDFRVLKPFFDSNSKTFRRNIDSQWIKNATTQICRTFDVGANLHIQHKDDWIEFKNEFIYINLSSLGKLRCKRLLPLSCAA